MIRTALGGTKKSLYEYFNIVRATEGLLITGILCPDPIAGDHTGTIPGSMTNHNPDQLADISESLIITDSAGYYYDAIVTFLKKSRHVLIMPDSSLSFYKVKKLTKIAEEAGVIIHFHQSTIDSAIKEMIREFINIPEYLSVRSHINTGIIRNEQTFFEILIRETCLIIDLNPYNPRKISASSVPFCSIDPEFLSARIEFENGTSAQLTISAFSSEESRVIEIYSQKRMITYDLIHQTMTMIDKNSSVPFIIKPEEIRSIMRKEDAFIQFFKSISKEVMGAVRFSAGIAAHQTAAGIIGQIMPCPVEN